MTIEIPDDSSELEILSAEEEQAIIKSFMVSRGDKGANAEEISNLLSQACSIRLQNDLLNAVISGQMICDWNGKEMTLGMP